MVDLDKLLALVTDNPRQSTRGLAEQLHCSHMTVDCHMNELGFVSKVGSWVSHDLTPCQTQQRIGISNFLLSQFPRENFLQDIITGDEKWVVHEDHARKYQWIPRGETPESEAKVNCIQRGGCSRFFAIFRISSTSSYCHRVPA
jgi:hypothetical protein